MAINKQTIISAFDDKLTLLQYLKTIEKLLKESTLTTIELIRVNNDYFKVKCNFNDGTFIESNNFLLMDANTLLNYLQGSESVIVDLNENSDKLKVHLNNDLLTKINFALVKPNEAPSDYVIVTINKFGKQDNISIGSSLFLDASKKTIETYRDIVNPINIFELLNMQLNSDVSLPDIQYTCNLRIGQIIDLLCNNINKGLIFDAPMFSGKYMPLILTYVNLDEFSYTPGGAIDNTNLQLRGVRYETNQIGIENTAIQIDFHAVNEGYAKVYISIQEL